jgi:predicted N-acetyltransferase YhbS
VLPAETIAVIESVGEISGKMRDEDNREVDFTMRAEGTERRSLERGMEIEASAQGSIEFSQAYVEDGLPMSLSVTGPLTVHIKGTLH